MLLVVPLENSDLTAKMWKQPKRPSTDEWIKRMWCMHTMEYDSALKVKEIWQYVTKWMNPEDIMLGEISQLQNDRYGMIHLYEVPKILRVEWWLEEVGNEESLINGHHVSVNSRDQLYATVSYT